MATTAEPLGVEAVADTVGIPWLRLACLFLGSAAFLLGSAYFRPETSPQGSHEEPGLLQEIGVELARDLGIAFAVALVLYALFEGEQRRRLLKEIEDASAAKELERLFGVDLGRRLKEIESGFRRSNDCWQLTFKAHADPAKTGYVRCDFRRTYRIERLDGGPRTYHIRHGSSRFQIDAERGEWVTSVVHSAGGAGDSAVPTISTAMPVNLSRGPLDYEVPVRVQNFSVEVKGHGFFLRADRENFRTSVIARNGVTVIVTCHDLTLHVFAELMDATLSSDDLTVTASGGPGPGVAGNSPIEVRAGSFMTWRTKAPLMPGQGIELFWR